MTGEQLRVTEGEESGKRLSVGAELLIGRVAPEDRGRLGGDPEISRRHAHVSRGADGRLTIEDLGSANGTFVNGRRIDAPRTLEPGDVVRMGTTVLEVTDGSGAEPVPAIGGPAGEPTRAAAAAGEVLVVAVGADPGRRLSLSDELVIGRGVSGEGRLSDDVEISRRHARITRDASGELSIEDLGSANGTFVNGGRVNGRQVLKVGDSVRIGLTTLELTDLARAHATPPAAPAPPLATPPRVSASGPPAPLSALPPLAVRPAAAAAADVAGDELTPELPPGAVFAGCRVEGVIGHGDMGVVYRAEELALQRQVALKLILPEYSREQRFRERFERESRIAAAIDHPNVIPIFDAGAEDGVPFIMMRLVEGTDMRALIAADGPIEPPRAARIIRQVGAALDAAHARGMLHRDVKPSNVLLARGDHVYLSDFGLAKHAAAAGGLTRQGSIVARAEYVAPEQVLNQPVDARADIYALGCLLFEALTGEAPFAGWHEGPAALAHVNAPPPSPTDLRPEVPRAFDDVVRRAMAKDPSERYSSGRDLGQAALQAAGGPQRASRPPDVAGGDAAPAARQQAAKAPDAAPRTPVPRPVPARRLETARWAIALAGLLIVAVGMVAALNGISSL